MRHSILANYFSPYYHFRFFPCQSTVIFHIIPLSERTIEILKQRLESKVDDWVFHSDLSKSGHLEEPKSAWTCILNQAKIKDLRIHDLRRTLGNWQAVAATLSAKLLDIKIKNQPLFMQDCILIR